MVLSPRPSRKRERTTTWPDSLDRSANTLATQRIRLQSRLAGRDGRRPSQKLPSTAICWHSVAAKTLRSLQPFHSSLPLEGVPASMGPGLKTVRGAKRGLGGMLQSSAVCAVTGKSTANDECIWECEKGRKLINVARNSERAERTPVRDAAFVRDEPQCPRKRDERSHRRRRNRAERTQARRCRRARKPDLHGRDRAECDERSHRRSQNRAKQTQARRRRRARKPDLHGRVPLGE
jgi:hypothetical protein